MTSLHLRMFNVRERHDHNRTSTNAQRRRGMWPRSLIERREFRPRDLDGLAANWEPGMHQNGNFRWAKNRFVYA